MKNNLSVLGYYTNNFGDLLMLKGIIDNVPKDYGCLFILTYGQLSVHELRDLGLANTRIRIINIKSKLKYAFTFMWALLTTKTIIWGGGTCFNSKENAYGGIKYMRLFHKFGASVNYIGVGINTNFKTKTLAESVAEAISISQLFLVRDKGSLKYIREEIEPSYNSLVPDPIFLNNFRIDRAAECPKEKLMFCAYRNVDDYFCNASEYRDAFINNLERVIKDGFVEHIIIYPSDKDVDYRDNQYIYRELVKRLKDSQTVEFMDSLSIKEALFYISKSSFIVTGRLHIGVVAAIFGIPFQLLNYSSKNRSFVYDIGINERSLVEYEALKDNNHIKNNFLFINSTINMPISCSSEIAKLTNYLTAL